MSQAKRTSKVKRPSKVSVLRIAGASLAASTRGSSSTRMTSEHCSREYKLPVEEVAAADMVAAAGAAGAGAAVACCGAGMPYASLEQFRLR